MMLKFAAVLMVLVIVLPGTARAVETPPVTEIRGVGVVKVNSRRAKGVWEQAVVITKSRAQFVGLDDFGGEIFHIDFNREGMVILAAGHVVGAPWDKLKRILSLPMSQEEFLSVLRYELPDGFSVVENKKDGVRWRKEKKKHLVVRFSRFFQAKRDLSYPGRILIQYKNNYFYLEWVKVTVK